jgi:hypothetical protein
MFERLLAELALVRFVVGMLYQVRDKTGGQTMTNIANSLHTNHAGVEGVVLFTMLHIVHVGIGVFIAEETDVTTLFPPIYELVNVIGCQTT